MESLLIWAKFRYVGKVLSDGRLSLPRKVREKLQLESGQEIEVRVRIRDDAQQLPDEAYEPLRKFIGLAKTGKPDASVHHDKYLYGKTVGWAPPTSPLAAFGGRCPPYRAHVQYHLDKYRNVIND